jgi:polyhydroxyalkanoate synthesis regulator phasin
MVNIEKTLREVKASLDDDRNTGFIPLLRKHHDYLKKYIPLLMDKSELNKKENDRRKEEISLEIRDLQQQLVYEKVKLKDISEFHFLRTAEEKRTQIQNQVSIIQDIQKQLQDLNNQLNSLN